MPSSDLDIREILRAIDNCHSLVNLKNTAEGASLAMAIQHGDEEAARRIERRCGYRGYTPVCDHYFGSTIES